MITAGGGPVHVYSFHMMLSWGRDPFTCFVTAQDMTSLWDCRRRASAHIGGVPGSVLYDRAKTAAKRHVGRGELVALHPEAIVFAAHYGFSITVATPRRHQSKGRALHQVVIVREHALVGRSFTTGVEMDRAFMDWVPVCRAQVHRTHGEVIAARAAIEHQACSPCQSSPTSSVSAPALGWEGLPVQLESALYSVPWCKVCRRMRVELRMAPGTVPIFILGPAPELLFLRPGHRARHLGGGPRALEGPSRSP